jgi:hypothetical protein
MHNEWHEGFFSSKPKQQNEKALMVPALLLQSIPHFPNHRVA